MKGILFSEVAKAIEIFLIFTLFLLLFNLLTGNWQILQTMEFSISWLISFIKESIWLIITNLV